MNLNNYTIKSQEAINKAVELAASNQQQAVEPGHLLMGIFQTDENVVDFLLKKLGIGRQIIESGLEKIVGSYPKVSGQQPYLSNETNQILHTPYA